MRIGQAESEETGGYEEKFESLLLALVMYLSLLPASAPAAEAGLPDWYFLFAIFRNVNADRNNGKGVVIDTTYWRGKKFTPTGTTPERLRST